MDLNLLIAKFDKAESLSDDELHTLYQSLIKVLNVMLKLKYAPYKLIVNDLINKTSVLSGYIKARNER